MMPRHVWARLLPVAGAVLLLAVLGACATPPAVSPPEGFAVYDDPRIVCAVSPDELYRERRGAIRESLESIGSE